MSYSTEDCKKYLVSIYSDTDEKGWKRVRKYNDEQKRVARDFQYVDGRTATILETPQGLIDKALLDKPKNIINNPFDKIRQENPENHKTKNPFEKVREENPENHNVSKNSEDEYFKKFMKQVLTGMDQQNNTYNNQNQKSTANKSSVDMMKDFLAEQEHKQKINDHFSSMFGEMPDILQQGILNHDNPIDQLVSQKENLVTHLLKDINYEELDTSEERFLYILVHGTQWEHQGEEQASTDCYVNIKNKEEFLLNLANKEVKIPNMYVSHILNTAAMIEAMDEGYVPFHVMDGQEAIKEMTNILIEMTEILEKNGKKVELDKDVVDGCVYTLLGVKEHCSMAECEGETDCTKEDIDNEIDRLTNFIKSKLPKKGLKP